MIAKRAPYLSIVLSAAALLVHFYHPLRPHLLYSRTALAQGEFWRLIACHWVHLNADHLLWSALTFFVLGAFCEVLDRSKFILAVGIATILIPMVIWFMMPQLEAYGGLSGLDCSLYSLWIVLLIQRERPHLKWRWIIFYTIMLILLPAKIIYEMSSGLTVFVNNNHAGMVPVPLSHMVGGIVGFAIGIDRLGRYFSRFRLAYIRFTM